MVLPERPLGPRTASARKCLTAGAWMIPSSIQIVVFLAVSSAARGAETPPARVPEPREGPASAGLPVRKLLDTPLRDTSICRAPDGTWYLTGTVEGFAPPPPFTLDEIDPAGLVSERPYTKDELLAYLDYGRKKCQATIEALSDETAGRRCRFPWGELSFLELLLYTMRHVQEHAAQLSLFLGQKIGHTPGWVKKARSSPAC